MFGLFRSSQPKPPLSRARMLAARPRRLVEGNLKPFDGGGARLAVPLKATGVGKLLVRDGRGERLTKTYELDAVGLFVWNACDGSLTYEALIRKVADHLKISHRESEVATGTFLQMLARKGLIGLEVPREEP